MQSKYGLTSLCDQIYGVQSMNRQTDRHTDRHIDRYTHRHTDRHTDRKVKSEGPKIMSYDICYLHTVVIGGSLLIKHFLQFIIRFIFIILVYLIYCTSMT